jgi:hypothetical protein
VSANIEVDDQVFDYLKAEAEPFVDTPNTVLRRLLGLDSARATIASAPSPNGSPAKTANANRRGRKSRGKSSAAKRTRAASGTLLPEERYERPLLKALADAGGQAPYREVVDAVGREMKGELLPADFENLSSGSIRWQSRLQFVRLRLIERGYLDKNAPRGIWGITDAGREALAKEESR